MSAGYARSPAANAATTKRTLVFIQHLRDKGDVLWRLSSVSPDGRESIEEDDVGIPFADRGEDRPAVGRPRHASGDERRTLATNAPTPKTFVQPGFALDRPCTLPPRTRAT